MGRRIGTLTFHHVINEGAILQAYALSTKLRQLFTQDEVCIIDYRSASAEQGSLRNTILGSKNPAVIWHRVRRYCRLKNFIRTKLSLSHHHLITDDYDRALEFLRNHYDVIVVGSDEVWKIERRAFARPFPNPYWLSETLPCRKIAYAASANKLACHDVQREHRDLMQRCLRAFDLVGVRDRHTYAMIREWGVVPSDKLEQVPDPTFFIQIPFDATKTRQRLLRAGVDFSRKLLGVTFSDRMLNEGIIPYYKKSGYQVIAMTVYNPLADVNLAGYLDPFEWAQTFQFLALCYTDLFHGTIFSLKAGIPFLSFDYFINPAYETKIHFLLDDLGLLKHYVAMQGQGTNPAELITRTEELIREHDRGVILDKVAEQQFRAERFLHRIQEIVG